MAVAEITRRIVVQGFVHKECLFWLVVVLKNFMLEERFKEAGGAVGEGRQWRDHLGSVVVVVCANRSGWFAKMEISPASQKGRRVVLCFPAGRLDSNKRGHGDLCWCSCNDGEKCLAVGTSGVRKW